MRKGIHRMPVLLVSLAVMLTRFFCGCDVTEKLGTGTHIIKDVNQSRILRHGLKLDEYAAHTPSIAQSV